MRTRSGRGRTDLVEDDIPPEEIEKWFQNHERSNRKKQVDCLNYAMYADDSTNPYEIEKRFSELAKAEENGVPADVAAKKVYLENALPIEIADVDGWLNGDTFDMDNDDDDDFDINADFDDDEMETFGRRKSGITREKKISIATFSDIFHLERFGASIERWPIRKLARTAPITAEGLSQIASAEKMKNYITIKSELYTVPDDVQYYQMNRINADEIAKLLVGNVDGIVLDPPLGIGGYTSHDFQVFLTRITKTGSNPHIMIWVDPDTIESVIDIANKVKLDPCDSVAVELFDSMMEPINLRSKLGFPQHTRMILLFRNHFANRQSIAQQRIKDTGWGIVYPNGKSRGRYGMPQTANEILEALLPEKKHKRQFIEVWPSRFSLRSNWISFDEV